MFDLNSNILSKCGVSAEDLQKAITAMRPNNGFSGVQMFLDAEEKYGINALFIVAHAAVESAWGTSFLAKTRNNLFGFNAVDSNPGEASSYPSQAASVDFYGEFLKTYYLTPGASYYNGDTPHGVFVEYSSSHDAEAETVVGVMNSLQEEVNKPAEPTPPPAPVQTVTYHVNPGEVLSEITPKYPGTTVEDWVNANKTKYPQITADFIEAGWNLVIPGSHTPAPSDNEIRITVPPAPEGDVSNLAAKYGSTVDELVAWNKERYPQLTPDFIEAGWTDFRVK